MTTVTCDVYLAAPIVDDHLADMELLIVRSPAGAAILNVPDESIGSPDA